MDRNMLSIPVPVAPNIKTALTSALRLAISSHAGESHHPDTFASDISSLVDLRSQVGQLEPHFASLTAAYTYYAQLVFASTKLPSAFPLAFPWSQPMVSTSLLSYSGATTAKNFIDSNASDEAAAGSVWQKRESFAVVLDGLAYVAHPLLLWERCNVLFAIAALLSEMGVQETRNDGASIKRAVGYFQTASAVFTHLETQLSPSLVQSIQTPTTPSHNLSPLSVQPLATLTLAQAQECFWQKAASDGMKAGTVAKLAKAVEDLYDQASQEAQRAESQAGMQVLSRTWLNHINTKRHHFAAASQFRKSQEDLSNSRYGDEIARLQLADTHVKSALAALKKGLPSSTSAQTVTNDLRGLQGAIESNLKRARKDNDLIYLEPLTPSASLSLVQGARMVQPKLPVQVAKPIDCLHAGRSTDALPALGKPLFGALVPYGAHIAISVYEDRKETWWRDTMENGRKELEALVQSTLDSLNQSSRGGISLPASLDALDRAQSGESSNIPTALLSQVERVQSQGGAQALERLRIEVEKVSAQNASTLDAAREALAVEADEDSAIRKQYPSLQRPVSHVAAAGYWRRYEELAATVKMAEQSDAVVREKMERWRHAWSILEGGRDRIVDELPRRQGAVSEADDSHRLTSSSPIVQELRKTLESIDDVLSDYAALSTECRAMVRNDDIREKVMREVARLSENNSSDALSLDVEINSSAFEDLFSQEFSKYNTIESSQINLFHNKINTLLETLQSQSTTLNDLSQSQSHYQSEFNSTLSSLQSAATKYFEVHGNLAEGRGFYESLKPMIEEFWKQVKEWKRSREVDVHDLVARLERSGLNENDGSEGQASQPQWGAWNGGAIRFSD